MIPAKIYPVVVPANGSFPLLVEGDMFKLLEVSGFSGVRVTGDTFGTIGDLKAGQGLDDTPFRRITFTDTSGTPQVLQVLVASSRFIDDRITGEVSVVDGEKARTLAGGMFMANPVLAGANQPCVQLWNPSGSGKNLILTQLGVHSNTAQGFNAWFGGIRATNVTALRAANKMAGAAMGVGQARTEDLVAPAGVVMMGGFVQAQGYVNLPIKGAIVITPGIGLMVVGGAPSTIGANFEWFEENA